jgi:osmotically inducible protein OsmC
MKRKASVAWNGGLMKGSGKISTESGALKDADYSFSRRFGEEPGTNPEELIAAAHASCFSMALSHELEKAGIGPGKIETTATVSLAKQPEGWKIDGVKLETVGTIEGAEEEAFLRAARTAKENCPVSKLLNAPIELEARLQPAGLEEAVMAS